MKTRAHNSIMTAIFLALLALPLAGKGGAGEGIRFIIPVETETFSKTAVLTVRVWNAEQLAISEETGNCTAGYNMTTQTEEISCPEGVVYREPTPEEFSFPVEDIDSSIEITAGTVREGEPYRVRVSGKSADNCNTASASAEGTAGSSIIRLENLEWHTTLMGCSHARAETRLTEKKNERKANPPILPPF